MRDYAYMIHFQGGVTICVNAGCLRDAIIKALYDRVTNGLHQRITAIQTEDDQGKMKHTAIPEAINIQRA